MVRRHWPAILYAFLLVAHTIPGHAADPASLTAEVEPAQITEDDTVSLKLGVQLDGSARVGSPEFSAPGLEIVNQFQSTYVESYYDNGRFGMRNNRQMTFVLKPSRPGTYTISKIRIDVNGTPLTASDLKVEVLPSGSSSSPSSGAAHGSRPLKPAPRDAGGRRSVPAFVRAELSKETLYKGEQLIVSYYLYQRARIFNISVDKYPILTGFLREDLEMPILQQRLNTERVTIEGVPWERALLLQYAAYPLQEGKLRIDQLSLKFNIYGAPDPTMDSDDPFSAFFQQMAPRPGSTRSDPVSVEVLPLPEAGKPAGYTGAVGQFELKASVDKTEIKAHQPITLTAQVRGRGNLASIDELKANWPPGVELYDSKKQEKTEKNGTGQKTFEYLLIPRQEGELTLPPLELSFFDPTKKEYVKLQSESLKVKVSAGDPGVQATSAANPAPEKSRTPDRPDSLRGLKVAPGHDAISIRGLPPWRWIYWLCVASFGIFLMYVGIEWKRRGRILSKKAARDESRRKSRSWEGLRKSAQAAASGELPWNDVMRAYEDLAGALFDQLDQRLPRKDGEELSSRSLPRRELRRILVEEQGMPAEQWAPLEQALEVAETVRFTGAAGVIPEAQARSHLMTLVEGAQRALSK